MNKKLNKIAPKLSKEIKAGLYEAQELELATQVSELIFQSFSHDSDEEVLMVHVRGGRLLNIVEKQIIGKNMIALSILNHCPEL